MNVKSLYRTLSIVVLLLGMGPGQAVLAQVKVGNNPTMINANAVLEIESGNKGVLLPRLALTATNSPSPMNSFTNGMLVYNTATQNDVTPGLYYSDGIKWMKIVAGQFALIPPGSWSTNGNSGTNTSNNFLGTTDNAGLKFRTNNMERMSIGANGWIGIGTSAPTAALEVKGQVVIDSLASGNIATDNILVANGGRVKSVPASSFMTNIQKRMETVVTSGQTIFNTPAPITDTNKIMLFRNGVQISFTQNNSTSITSEIPCMAGDEIRIIQLL